jgi:N utilization substance protein B
VQVLYQIAQTGGAAADLVSEFIEFRLGQVVDGATFVPADITLLTAIVRGADAEQAELNDWLAGAVRAPLERERLELLLRVILLAGAWELRRNVDIPAAIVISEYVVVANGFYGGPEPGLINGVLDRLARTARPWEFGEAGPGPIPDGSLPAISSDSSDGGSL